MGMDVAGIRATIARTQTELTAALPGDALSDPHLANARGVIGDPSYYAFGDLRNLIGSGSPYDESTLITRVHDDVLPSVRKYGSRGDTQVVKRALGALLEAGVAIRPPDKVVQTLRQGARLPNLEKVDAAAIKTAQQKLSHADTLLSSFDRGAPAGDAIEGALTRRRVAFAAAGAAAIASIGIGVLLLTDKMPNLSLTD